MRGALKISICSHHHGNRVFSPIIETQSQGALYINNEKRNDTNNVLWCNALWGYIGSIVAEWVGQEEVGGFRHEVSVVGQCTGSFTFLTALHKKI